MKIYYHLNELTSHLLSLKSQEQKIGFIPTMGALHDGHISLVKKASHLCDITLVSIFVNPTQFNNEKDFVHYPKTPEKDLRFLEKNNCDLVFIPNHKELYTHGISANHYKMNGLDSVMEGAFRDNHFQGVLTIIDKFFDLIRPDLAFFGEKDYQQLKIIENFSLKSYPEIQIVPVEIKREKGGLAMSSRNVRLSLEQRSDALIIYKTLSQIKTWLESLSIEEIHTKVNQQFSQSNITLEYFEIVSTKDLKPVNQIQPKESYRAFIAAYAGNVRLIDNISLS